MMKVLDRLAEKASESSKQASFSSNFAEFPKLDS